MSDLIMFYEAMSDLVDTLQFEQNFGNKFQIRKLNFTEIV